MNSFRTPLPVERFAALLSLMLALALGAMFASASGHGTIRFRSPDHHLVAVVAPAPNLIGAENNESRVSILASDSAPLRTHDFSSSDGEHGYGVDGAEWTPDSQYFVFRMRSSGGHSPQFAPIAFWSRRANRFYSLNDYTADQTFSIAAPDRVKASTWPDMRPAAVSLRTVKRTDVTELR